MKLQSLTNMVQLMLVAGITITITITKNKSHIQGYIIMEVL
jgi:hypothetical protein